MPLSQYARDNALSWTFTTSAPTEPTTWYLSLHTGFPGDTGTTILNEFVSGSSTGYVRTQLTGGTALALSSHIIQNGGAVTIGPAGNTWQVATYLGICDASTSGHLLAYVELSQYGSSLYLAAAQLANPGSGYAVSDTITLTGGGGAVLTVDAVATVNGVAGVPTQFRVSAHGSVSSIPANPMATTTSGSGSGATVLGVWLQSPQSFQLNNGDTLILSTGQLQITME